MHDLIKITDKEGVQLVKAKELYEFLGLDITHWKRWYEKNIIKNQFASENHDYWTLALKASSNNGSWTKDFDYFGEYEIVHFFVFDCFLLAAIRIHFFASLSHHSLTKLLASGVPLCALTCLNSYFGITKFLYDVFNRNCLSS